MYLYSEVYQVTIDKQDYAAQTIYYFRNYDRDKLATIKLILSAPYSECHITNPIIVVIGNNVSFTSSTVSNIQNVFKSVGITCTDFQIYTIVAGSIDQVTKWNRYDAQTMSIKRYAPGNDIRSWFITDFVKSNTPEATIKNKRRHIKRYSEAVGLNFDKADIEYYYRLFKSLHRNPTETELFSLGQSNSEHSRHHFFRGIIKGFPKRDPYLSLFDEVKSTNVIFHPYGKTNSLVAFRDNSSVIRGYAIDRLQPVNTEYKNVAGLWHPVFTAETHNFPTSICPFPGAATGVGGRIRDVQAVGRGGIPIAGIAGYCVGDIYNQSGEYVVHPKTILIEASNGASNYANNFGEPLVAGFCRSSSWNIGKRIEWCKCIMFSGGIGICHDKHLNKLSPATGDSVVMLGGPAYRIGLGGGSNSSQTGGDAFNDMVQKAIQRADPEQEQKLNRVIRSAIELCEHNPIRAIHDQGAGGPCNCIQEIVYPKTACIDLDKFRLGDTTMSSLEIWCSEFQEVNVCLVSQAALDTLNDICMRENCGIAVVGCLYDAVPSDQSGKITVYRKEDVVVNLPLRDILGDYPKKEFGCLKPKQVECLSAIEPLLDIYNVLRQVLGLVDVGSKRFLCNKIDRSVGGLVVQQPCVGAYHTPIADYGLVKMDYEGYTGICTGIGEQPYKGFLDMGMMARLAVAEMLTNMVWVVSSDITDIKVSTNWMWSGKTGHAGGKLVVCCDAMTDFIKKCGIAVDGGKDSLSMSMRVGNVVVNSPDQLVISGYVTVPDIRLRVTPELKPFNSKLLWVKTGCECRLGGSQYLRAINKPINSDDCPDVDADAVVKLYKGIQGLITEGMILAGHDVSDGGVLTTIIEMQIASENMSVQIYERPQVIGRIGCNLANHQLTYLFAEEVGVVIQVDAANVEYIGGLFDWCYELGEVKSEKDAMLSLSAHRATSCINLLTARVPVRIGLVELRQWWESANIFLEESQCANGQWRIEMKNMYTVPTQYVGIYQASPRTMLPEPVKMCVLRAEGCNGDRELAQAFILAGFAVYDVTMSDLRESRVDINNFRGIAYCGGFSYMDVLGAGQGWAMEILNNERLSAMFDKFYERTDTFSFGVCNGAQMMLKAGFIKLPSYSRPTIVTSNTLLDNSIDSILSMNLGPVTNIQYGQFGRNLSERFESRWSTVCIQESNSIMLKGLAGYSIGVWVAHGEGRFMCIQEPKGVVMKYCKGIKLADGEYPYNPNGSMYDIAGICSDDGRHLCMMPHPERSIYGWQMPYNPGNEEMSPWLKMFENAYEWTK